MGAFDIIIGILLLVVSIVIIAVILLQEGRRAGISGAISGAAETFLSKNKARTLDSKLQKWTKYICVAFMALVLVANVVAMIVSK
ncbi:MAG: preprotein translocase subunit SecG [Clostridia bacterium]|nr:preprotein translocase subunit SecG [Clostridia bacterium]